MALLVQHVCDDGFWQVWGTVPAWRSQRRKGWVLFPRRGPDGVERDIQLHFYPISVPYARLYSNREGDLILGKYRRSALGTLVERTTRYTILVPLGEHKDAASVREAYAEAFKSLPAELKKSLTYDQGKEMSEHEQFTIDTGIQVYFAHPGSPWERGTNENTNGLIRQYFPKGTDFTQVSKEEILEVQRKLNDRPRRALGYLKPDEVINQLVALKT